MMIFGRPYRLRILNLFYSTVHTYSTRALSSLTTPHLLPTNRYCRRTGHAYMQALLTRCWYSIRVHSMMIRYSFVRRSGILFCVHSYILGMVHFSSSVHSFVDYLFFWYIFCSTWYMVFVHSILMTYLLPSTCTFF